MATVQIVRLDIKDKEKAVDVFLAAFERDPVMSYFFGDYAPRTLRDRCR